MKGENPWIEYVRDYQSARPDLSWAEALQEASVPYQLQQKGGAMLSPQQSKKMIGLAIRFLGKDSFYGIDPKTIMDLVNLLFQAKDYSGSLSRISNSSTTNPWTQSIASISFRDGPQGVRNDMEQVFQAIDQQPDSKKIYKTLCAVYRDILYDSTGIFSQIMGTLYPASSADRDALKTQIVYAIKSLNFEQLTAAYLALPGPLQKLLRDPESLRENLDMILDIVAQKANLGSFVGNYLDPALTTAINAVQQVVPLVFASLLLLERCDTGISRAQEVALNSLIP